MSRSPACWTRRTIAQSASDQRDESLPHRLRPRRGGGETIATALGWGDVASIALAVGLAFLFGYSLTSLPLVRAKLPFAAIVPIALAANTVSIARPLGARQVVSRVL